MGYLIFFNGANNGTRIHDLVLTNYNVYNLKEGFWLKISENRSVYRGSYIYFLDHFLGFFSIYEFYRKNQVFLKKKLS